MITNNKILKINVLIIIISYCFIAQSYSQTLSSTSATLSTTTFQTRNGAVKMESLAKLDHPWGMTFLPNGDLLITEKPGRLQLYAHGKLATIKGVPKVAFRNQGGLLDVEIDPNFAQNQFVYLFYTEPAEYSPPRLELIPDPRLGEGVDEEDNQLKGGAVARGRLVDLKLLDVEVIWRQVPKTIGLGHYGGRLAFSPDGKLFISSGERQRFSPAQDPTSNLGKIIRINPDGTIPDDNPFKGHPNIRSDVWTFGHRNPLGMAFHPVSKQLWIHEMGPAHGDELNLIEKGQNYGWPIVSNGYHYNGVSIPHHDTRPIFTSPKYYWYPAISPSGLIFYTGDRFKDWKDNIFIGGLSSKTLVRLTFDGERFPREERLNVNQRIRDVIQAPDESLLLLSDGIDGELLRLTPEIPPASN